MDGYESLLEMDFEKQFLLALGLDRGASYEDILETELAYAQEVRDYYELATMQDVDNLRADFALGLYEACTESEILFYRIGLKALDTLKYYGIEHGLIIDPDSVFDSHPHTTAIVPVSNGVSDQVEDAVERISPEKIVMTLTAIAFALMVFVTSF